MSTRVYGPTVERLRDEIVGKEEECPKNPLLNAGMFINFLMRLHILGALTGNFDRHGGAPSFLLFDMAMIRRAGTVRTGELVAADALIRKEPGAPFGSGEDFRLRR